MKTMNDFTNLYSLSKTLRFELIPQGKTLENIQNNGFLENDEHRAESYKKVKKIIDEYHKLFIENSLSVVSLQYDDEGKKNSLWEFYHIYLNKGNENRKKLLEEIQTKLRKQIADIFKDKGVNRLYTKELIKEDLPHFVQNEEEKALVAEFENFTTYFTGFHENRKNMYSADEIATGITYRLIHENLPRFIDNMGVFEKVRNTSVAERFDTLYTQFEEYLNVNGINEMFELNYYSTVLTQKQIDVYNAIIGGKTVEEEKIKIQGLNEYINLYNQQQTDKTKRLPKLKPLYKQILSDRNAISWLPQVFSSDGEVLESIEKCYQDICDQVFCPNNQNRHTLIDLLLNINEFDTSKIYIRNDLALTDISQKMFGSYSVIQKAIELKYITLNPQKKKESFEQYEERIGKMVKNEDSFSIHFITECLSALGEIKNNDEICDKDVVHYFKKLGKTKEQENLFVRIEKNYNLVKELLKLGDQYPENKSLSQVKDEVEKIKNLLDSIKELQRFVKPLLGKGNEPEKDQHFYGELTKFWTALDQVTPLYNKVRNYMTKKPYSLEKFKLNFENSTLLDGWDMNKEEANTSVLFIKGECFYLGIMDKNYNKIFREIPDKQTDNVYHKVNYKLLPGASKMLPKVFFSNSNIEYFQPDNKIIEIRNHGSHTKSGKPQEGFEKRDFDIDDCRLMIDFFKASIEKHTEWRNFNYKFNETNTYQSIDEFYREVESQGYSISYTNIDAEYIDSLVESGKLYLFQIYNKDFSEYSKGTPNMHTLYWKMLFDRRNLADVVYKLNGQAEVFYRKSSIKNENTVIHVANEKIANKNILNVKKDSVFSYDIVKDKRYTLDKFQFHVPITLNFKNKTAGTINETVNHYLKQTPNTHIIGIDRGERHLLYLSLIDPKGKIIKQFSLNEIANEYNGNTYRTNYHDLLQKREKERMDERQSWKAIETIKELKEGYISQVINKIATLMVEYNAIVALEDLNFGFMRGRQKVEKSVYQKFEKMLIDKLNYLVDKKKEPTEPGGTLKALQLTNKFESFKAMGKQNGFLFYIPAWNTSKIDPVTGYVNFFDTRYESVGKAKEFFEKFKEIRYNPEKDYFEFVVDNYTAFNPKAEGTRQNWIICTHGDRINTFRNKEKNSEWDNEIVVLTPAFKELFKSNNIDFTDSDLKSKILGQNDKKFFEELLHLFKLTVQMRNSITNSETDYMISPVADKNGNFYDSRKAPVYLPKDADANGAYNIARKGLWIIDQIKKSGDDFKNLKLAISNREWLQFAQNQDR